MPLLVVVAWAFAEAILWFLVADIPISFVALRWGWRRGALAALAAALAATAGGLVTSHWAAHDPAGAHRAIAALPAIDEAMIARIHDRAGYRAMLAGSLSGVPYKLYALDAGSSGRPLLPFLLLSPLARLPRFLLVAAMTSGGGKLLSRWLSLRQRMALLAAVWIAFYASYFAVMPN